MKDARPKCQMDWAALWVYVVIPPEVARQENSGESRVPWFDFLAVRIARLIDEPVAELEHRAYTECALQGSCVKWRIEVPAESRESVFLIYARESY